MIVRDEAPIIARCLDSLKHWIDYWVIVDTGSVDQTERVIVQTLAGIPGDFIQRPWRNFAENRSEALRFARGKGDYVLIVDADEVLKFAPDFRFPGSDRDCYKIETRLGGLSYFRRQLVNNRLNWYFEGVVHERLVCEGDFSEDVLAGLVNTPYQDSARNRDPRKYQKDAALLEEQLRREPGNSRCVFYLAQSYRDAGDYQRALDNYTKRLAMGGRREEVWYALYQIGYLQERLNYSYGEVIRSYAKAFDYLPERAEPLRRIALLLGLNGETEQARRVAALAADIPMPTEGLFVETSTYTQDWLTSDIEALMMPKVMSPA